MYRLKDNRCSSAQRDVSVASHKRGTEADPSTNFKSGKQAFPGGASVRHHAKEVTEEATPCEFTHLLSSSEKKKRRNKREMRKGKNWVSLDICQLYGACHEQVSASQHFLRGGMWHTTLLTPCTEEEITDNCDSLLLGLPRSSYLNCQKIYPGEERLLSLQLHAK